jgi:hypothetical protein
MKRKTLTILLIFSSLLGFPQKAPSIIKRDTVAGKNYLTNTEIIAHEYIFSDRIDKTDLDTSGNLLTIQLRGTTKNGKWLDNSGDVMVYDLEGDYIKWFRKINYEQASIDQVGHVMVQTSAGTSYYLDIEDGKSIWEVRNSIYFFDIAQNIGIGYKFKASTGYTNKLEGIDLTNGNILWTREINRTYGWNSLMYLDDSVLLIAASGLHSVNIKTGKGWDYETVTGEKDYTATIAANAAGAVLGVLTGTYAYTTGYNVVRDVVSNVLIDSNYIYFASKEKIACLNKKGIMVWNHDLPEKSVSKSTIFIKNELIFMINKGYAFMGYRQLDYGDAFIAAFDKYTGRQVYYQTINSKEEQINAFLTDHDSVFLVFKNRIAKHSLTDGSMLLSNSFPVENTGELKFFIGDQVYIKSDSDYVSLVKSDPSSCFVYSGSSKTLVIDRRLEIERQIDYEDLFVFYAEKDNYRFLANKGNTVVLDKDNHLAAEFRASSRSIIVGHKLYDVQENSFFEIDLSGIIDNQ